jgi:ABC-type uncharacterized transport system fused permease/ATPase subunit
MKSQTNFLQLVLKCGLYQFSIDQLLNVGVLILPIVSNLFRVFIFIDSCEKIQKKNFLKKKKKKIVKSENYDYISFKNVNFKTPVGKTLCNELNFKVKKNEPLLIMGPSGTKNKKKN